MRFDRQIACREILQSYYSPGTGRFVHGFHDCHYIRAVLAGREELGAALDGVDEVVDRAGYRYQVGFAGGLK